MRRTLVGLVLIVPLACGKFQKAKECGVFAEGVNAFIDDTQSTDKAAGYAGPAKAAAESRQLAERYRKLSTDLGKISITTPELKPAIAEYRKLADDAALALDGAAQAMDRPDLELARTKRLDFDRVAKREAPLVKEINALCGR